MAAAYIDLYKVFEPFRHDVTKASKAVFKIKVCTFVVFLFASHTSSWFLPQYHKTIDAVYLVENSVETLLDLLQRYREKAGDKVAEKGGSIFTKACFLLALLLQDKHRAVVRSYSNIETFEIYEASSLLKLKY